MPGWPLISNKIRRGSESNTFGMVRHHADGREKPHQGWDFFAVIGTPCFAVAHGMVHAVTNGGDYGLVIVLAFVHEGKPRFAAYAHLRRADVEPGDTIKQGEQIGLTGDSGNAKGMKGQDQHLHFELRTIAAPGLGLGGRLSPIEIFGTCPLKAAIEGEMA